jgi:hypothetical protein
MHRGVARTKQTSDEFLSEWLTGKARCVVEGLPVPSRLLLPVPVPVPVYLADNETNALGASEAQTAPRFVLQKHYVTLSFRPWWIEPCELQLPERTVGFPG